MWWGRPYPHLAVTTRATDIAAPPAVTPEAAAVEPRRRPLAGAGRGTARPAALPFPPGAPAMLGAVVGSLPIGRGPAVPAFAACDGATGPVVLRDLRPPRPSVGIGAGAALPAAPGALGGTRAGQAHATDGTPSIRSARARTDNLIAALEGDRLAPGVDRHVVRERP